jgi:hypothetical protein
MAGERVYDTRVRLEDVRYLFRECEDPFDPDYDASGTLEQIANELYAHTSFRHVRLTLELPAADAVPETVERLRGGIRRYAERQVRDTDRTRLGERWRASVALVIAILALGLFVFVNRALRNVESYWATLFSEGVTIGFWVAVWFPIDSLAYGQWQHRVDRRIYGMVRDLELVVVPTTEAVSPDPGR